MTKWSEELHIADLREQYLSGGEVINNPSELGMAIVDRIEQLDAFSHDGDLQDIAEKMSEVETAEEFNEALGELYDWGDQETCPFGEIPANRTCKIIFA